MATSGSWDFGATGTTLIASAYEDLGVIEPGATVATADSTLAIDRLQKIIKQYQGRSDGAQGLKIHTRQRVTLMLAKGQHSYLIGPAATDSRSSTAVGRTTISADEASGQTVLSITSNIDTTTYPGTTITMTASDIIGIELNDGTIQWTTISGTPASTATVAVALTAAASAGNYVWWFTARAQRIPYVESVLLRYENYNDVPLNVYRTAEEYDQGVSSKYADGTPTSVLVEPLRLNTRLTFDSQPTNVTDQIIITGFYPSEDVDAAANDIAFPQEALRFLQLELMFSLSLSIGRWTKEMEMNRQEARAMYLNLNPENSVLYAQPGGIE